MIIFDISLITEQWYDIQRLKKRKKCDLKICHLEQKELLIQERDDKLDDMKTIVGRLTGTNNELLAILSTKVRLEESLKSLEAANRKLIQVKK